jgi:transcriptional regulator with XRE-family HTH domain
MHSTYLSAIERGLRNPTWVKLCDLAQVLGITVSQLARVAEAEVYGAVYSPDQRRLTPEEFEQHFGHLPTEGEG